MRFRFYMIALLFWGLCHGQQTPAFSEYSYNPFIINSAHAGALQNAEISLAHSGFFRTIDGSPESTNFSFRTPLRNRAMGLGGGVIHDEIGVTTSTSVFGAYSYRIPLDFDDEPYWKVQEPTGISFGLSFGLQQRQENLLGLGLGADQLLSQNINVTIPIFGVGIVLNYAKYYVAFSTPNILGDRFANDDNLDVQSPYYAYMGYRFYFTRFENLLLKPNVLLRYEKGAPIQADFNLSFTMRSKLEFGFGYRTNSSLNLLVGMYLFDSLRLVYSYNLAAKELTIGNTHGLSLNFRFNRGFEAN